MIVFVLPPNKVINLPQFDTEAATASVSSTSGKLFGYNYSVFVGTDGTGNIEIEAAALTPEETQILADLVNAHVANAPSNRHDELKALCIAGTATNTEIQEAIALLL